MVIPVDNRELWNTLQKPEQSSMEILKETSLTKIWILNPQMAKHEQLANM